MCAQVCSLRDVCASSSAWLAAAPGLMEALRSRPVCEAHDLGSSRQDCVCQACGRHRHVRMVLQLSGRPTQPGWLLAASPGADRPRATPAARQQAAGSPAASGSAGTAGTAGTPGAAAATSSEELELEDSDEGKEEVEEGPTAALGLPGSSQQQEPVGSAAAAAAAGGGGAAGAGAAAPERQQFYVGSFCAARLLLYHSLHHFKTLLGWKLQREHLRAVAHARAVGSSTAPDDLVPKLLSRLQEGLYEAYRDLCDAADGLVSAGASGGWRGGGAGSTTLNVLESVLVALG